MIFITYTLLLLCQIVSNLRPGFGVVMDTSLFFVKRGAYDSDSIIKIDACVYFFPVIWD